MRRSLALGAILSLVAMAAQAAAVRPGCYSGADIEAEQAVHFQAKLKIGRAHV